VRLGTLELIHRRLGTAHRRDAFSAALRRQHTAGDPTNGHATNHGHTAGDGYRYR